MFELNPFDSLLENGDTLALRSQRTSFWQKIVDFFNASLGLDLYNLHIYFDFDTNQYRSYLKIPATETEYEEHKRAGLADYATLFIPRLIIYGSFRLMLFADRQNLPEWAFVSTIIFVGVFFVLAQVAQFIIAAALTFISLPFIAVTHLLFHGKGENIKQEILADENAYNVTTDRAHYLDSTDNMEKLLHNENYEVESIKVKAFDHGDEKDFCMINLRFKHNDFRSTLPSDPTTDFNMPSSFTIIFKNNYAGHAAFLKFCELNIGGIKAPAHADKIGKEIALSEMFTVSYVVSQLTRPGEALAHLPPEIYMNIPAHAASNRQVLNEHDKWQLLYGLTFFKRPKSEEQELLEADPLAAIEYMDSPNPL